MGYCVPAVVAVNWRLLYLGYGLAVMIGMVVVAVSVWCLTTMNAFLGVGYQVLIRTNLIGEHWVEVGMILLAVPAWVMIFSESLSSMTGVAP